jgi:hypothetical protein
MMEIEMQNNSEFLEFSRRFHQDITDVCPNEVSMIKFAISPFQDAKIRANLRSYIDEIVSESVSDHQLQQIWWSSAADIVFSDSGALRSFLRRVREHL